MSAPGIVVIGRNEGQRLVRCLSALQGAGATVVYVDSGSSDGSFEAARRLGAEPLALDMSRPFTAARARNAGLARLREIAREARYVQFIDGDCELQPGWLAAACAWLDAQPRVAAVCGRLRERHPERSLYNRLCDLEWDRPPGDTPACGGIAMMRIAALDAVGAFDATLVAGEEPELCARLRAGGWTIWRLADEMALHDADMHRFSQWWRRACRGGYAAAQTAWVRRAQGERPYLRARRSMAFWALGLPLAALAGIAAFGAAGALPLLAYPAQIARLAWRTPPGTPLRVTRAAFLVLARFAEARGHWQFHSHQRRGQASAARFDYKT